MATWRPAITVEAAAINHWTMSIDPPASPIQDYSQNALKAGTRVGAARYVLKRKLGSGEFTEVWLARDVKWERDVTLKLLTRSLSVDAHLLERLDHEIRRSAQLAHPAIARVYDVQCDHQTAFIVTEHVDGWPLAAVKLDRPQKRFRIDEINLWVHQLCAGLDYAHHGFCLVHRGLKPANLILDRREQLKMTDFGIDQAVRAALAPKSPAAGLAYMSPQQIDVAEASVLDDIYSLGATIYDLLTGTPPFFGGKLIEQIHTAVAPRLRDRLKELGSADEIPNAWEETVAACLAKDPGKRPQSANEVADRLQKVNDPAQLAPAATSFRASARRLIEASSQRAWNLKQRARRAIHAAKKKS